MKLIDKDTKQEVKQGSVVSVRRPGWAVNSHVVRKIEGMTITVSHKTRLASPLTTVTAKEIDCEWVDEVIQTAVTKGGKVYTLNDAINAAKVLLAKEGIPHVNLDKLPQKARPPHEVKISLDELNEVSKELYLDTMYWENKI